MAQQTPDGEVEFQAGAMTASEDNLVLLRNKLSNPPLKQLFEKIGLEPHWAEQQGRLLAYLNWPLELRGAVHRTLFPAMAAGGDLQPTTMFAHRLEELQLETVELDFDHCLPDELIYHARLALVLGPDPEAPGAAGAAVEASFTYVQLVWAEGAAWRALLGAEAARRQAGGVVRLLLGGIMDPLRAEFLGHRVLVLAEDQPGGIAAGSAVDEIVLPGEPERHLGEEIEAMLNQHRLQPMLRDLLLGRRPAATTPRA